MFVERTGPPLLSGPAVLPSDATKSNTLGLKRSSVMGINIMLTRTHQAGSLWNNYWKIIQGNLRIKPRWVNTHCKRPWLVNWPCLQSHNAASIRDFWGHHLIFHLHLSCTQTRFCFFLRFFPAQAMVSYLATLVWTQGRVQVPSRAWSSASRDFINIHEKEGKNSGRRSNHLLTTSKYENWEKKLCL